MTVLVSRKIMIDQGETDPWRNSATARDIPVRRRERSAFVAVGVAVAAFLTSIPVPISWSEITSVAKCVHKDRTTKMFACLYFNNGGLHLSLMPRPSVCACIPIPCRRSQHCQIQTRSTVPYWPTRSTWTILRRGPAYCVLSPVQFRSLCDIFEADS